MDNPELRLNIVDFLRKGSMRIFRNYENYIVHPNGFIFSNFKKDFIKQEDYKNTKYGKIVYPRVHLSLNGKAKHFAVARIIAECYIPNPDNKPEVNHKDGDRFNNHVDNLEWVTAQENIDHSVKNGLAPRGERQGISIATEDIVKLVDQYRREGLTYPQISKILGMKESTVGAIGRRQNWKHVK